MKRSSVLLYAALLAGCAAHKSPGAPVKTYEQEIADWHDARMARLQKPGGWLSLAGLFWLEPGANAVGSDESARVRLPAAAPAKLGSITLTGKAATLTLEAGAGVKIDDHAPPAGTIPLHSDVDPKVDPTQITVGSLTFYVIDRGGKQGVRVSDADAPTRKGFPGIETFAVDRKWRVEARFEPPRVPRTISIPTVIDGVFEEMDVAGTAIFALDGIEYRLEPVLEKGETDLFFIFKDATAGHETYGAGRFLYASPAKDGKVILDFNRAYNPPCALTPYATCPLPPPQNVLPLRIEAGEKKYGHHG